MSQLHLNYLPLDYIVLHYIVLYKPVQLITSASVQLITSNREWFTCVVEKKEQREEEDRSPPHLQLPASVKRFHPNSPPDYSTGIRQTHTHAEGKRESHTLEQRRESSQDSPNRALHFITHRDHAEHNPRQRYRAHIKSGEGTGFKELRVPLENRSGLKWGFVDSVRLESWEDARLGPVAVLRSLRRRRAQTLRAHGESPHTTLHNHFIITHINRKIAYEQILMVWMLKNMFHSISDYFNVL